MLTAQALAQGHKSPPFTGMRRMGDSSSREPFWKFPKQGGRGGGGDGIWEWEIFRMVPPLGQGWLLESLSERGHLGASTCPLGTLAQDPLRYSSPCRREDEGTDRGLPGVLGPQGSRGERVLSPPRGAGNTCAFPFSRPTVLASSSPPDRL